MCSVPLISPVSDGLRSELRAELAHVYEDGCAVGSKRTPALTALVDAAIAYFGSSTLFRVLTWATEQLRDDPTYVHGVQVLLGVDPKWHGIGITARQNAAAAILGKSARSLRPRRKGERDPVEDILEELADRLAEYSQVLKVTVAEPGDVYRPELLQELSELSEEEGRGLLARAPMPEAWVAYLMERRN